MMMMILQQRDYTVDDGGDGDYVARTRARSKMTLESFSRPSGKFPSIVMRCNEKRKRRKRISRCSTSSKAESNCSVDSWIS